MQGDKLGNNFFSWNYMEQLSAQIKEHVVKSGQKRKNTRFHVVIMASTLASDLGCLLKGERGIGPAVMGGPIGRH